MADGPAVISSASWSIWPSSWYDDGANTVMPGTLVSSTMSSTPWWLGPSSPVMPARSRQKTTGCPCRPTSRFTWSKARVRNVEYTATTGRRPPMAMPAAAVTACCSAMPTSNMRSGKRSAKGSRPVESGMAAVMATSSGRASPSLMIDSVKAAV